jgi:hypothetical protein
MKLLFENWRKFLKEQGSATVPAKLGARRSLKAMDPADIKTPTPQVQGWSKDSRGIWVQDSRPDTKKKEEMPEVQLSDKIQMHNASKLRDYYKSKSSVRGVFAEGWPGGGFEFERAPRSTAAAVTAEKLINYIVANNPVFHNNKIVEYLGAGTFGFVVELDNDHALKIFVGSFDPKNVDSGTWIDREAKSDVVRYKGSQQKAFTGTGQAGELMVYDQGQLKTPRSREVEEPVVNPETGMQEIDPKTGEGKTKIVLHNTWHYAEMQQLRTLSKWLRYVHKIDEFDQRAVRVFNLGLDDEIEALKHFADEVNEAENMPPEDREKLGLDDAGQARFINNSIKYLDKVYAKNLFDQIKEILKTKSFLDIRDIRGANIGVSQQDESLPIIFDY